MMIIWDLNADSDHKKVVVLVPFKDCIHVVEDVEVVSCPPTIKMSKSFEVSSYS